MKSKWPAFGFGCLMLAGATMVARPGSAQTAQEISATADGRMASISAVDVSREGEQTTVRISGTGNLRFQTSRLDSPPRLVLDFSNTKLATRRNQVTGEYAPVQEVRLGQSASGQSRVVIDLSESASFTSKTEGSSVVISFDTAEPQVTTGCVPSEFQEQATRGCVRQCSADAVARLADRKRNRLREPGKCSARAPAPECGGDASTGSHCFSG